MKMEDEETRERREDAAEDNNKNMNKGEKGGNGCSREEMEIYAVGGKLDDKTTQERKNNSIKTITKRRK